MKHMSIVEQCDSFITANGGIGDISTKAGNVSNTAKIKQFETLGNFLPRLTTFSCDNVCIGVSN